MSAGCSLGAFEDATGLSLTDDNGLKDDLPPITTFLNRLLALTIDMQGVLFTAFEEACSTRIEGAIAAGVYDLGLETLRAESFRVTDRARVIYTHPDEGERIIGRKVSPAWAANADHDRWRRSSTPDDAFMALMDGRTILDLAEGLQLRRVRVMGANRIELSGFTDTHARTPQAYGLFHEIISWKLRMFVPTDAAGPRSWSAC
jgi:hypothetical protein